jgi:hypothetical protein
MGWQNVAVMVVVIAAGGYLARLAWQSIARRKAAACGGCGTCPASQTAEPAVHATIGPLAESTPRHP